MRGVQARVPLTRHRRFPPGVTYESSLTLEPGPVELPAIVHLTSAASTPVAIATCTYLGVRTLVVMVAVFGPKEWAGRALQVLKVLRRDHRSLK
jgi:hypothetical protein